MREMFTQGPKGKSASIRKFLTTNVTMDCSQFIYRLYENSITFEVKIDLFTFKKMFTKGGLK